MTSQEDSEAVHVRSKNASCIKNENGNENGYNTSTKVKKDKSNAQEEPLSTTASEHEH
jgi:hypothetical protein